jgi:cytochrome c oxidase subunit II
VRTRIPPVAHRRTTAPVRSVGTLATCALLVAACTTRDPTVVAPALSAGGERGRALAVDRGCVNCHSTDGSERLGPTWQSQWGTEVPLDGGGTAVYDEAYVRTAIVDPDAERREGQRIAMPAFDDLTDAEIADITTYIRELPDEVSG